jgi:hypothetical protein
MNLSIRALLCALLIIASLNSFSQIAHEPGKIIRTARTSAGRLILDPNSDGWITASGNAWAINADDTTASGSEIHYRAIKAYGGEPCCDLRRGADHRFSDFVPDANNNGVYLAYIDGGTDATRYLKIRMRMGTVIPGSKGFSLLIDTDSSYGASGARPDPNYVAQTTGINGNRGFEIEVVLETNFRLAIYNIDGRGNPTDNIDIQDMAVNPWRVFYDTDWEARSQVSFAATTESGDADYFIDWYVTLEELKLMKTSNGGTSFIQSGSQSLRIIPTTVMAPKPSTAGPISDIYGAGDSVVITNMPPIKLSSNQVSGICTAAPTITSASASGSNNVKGTWTRGTEGSSTATIYIYKGTDTTTVLATVLNVSSGATWQVTVAGITASDSVFAKAKGSGLYESRWCFKSNVKKVGSCDTRPGPLTITTFTASTGIDGAGYADNISGSGSGALSAGINYIHVNKVNSGSITRLGTVEYPSSYSNKQNGSNAAGRYNLGSTTGTWQFNGGSGGPSNAALTAGEYVFYQETAAGCLSGPTFFCRATATGSTKAPMLTSGAITVYTTEISGGFDASGVTPVAVRIYYDSVYAGDATVTGGTSWSYTFSQPLASGKEVRIRSMATEGGGSFYCAGNLTQTVGAGSCSNKVPIFNVDSTTSKIGEGVIISGIGTPGGTVKVYKQPANTQVGATVTVGGDGTWALAYTAASADVSYNATLTTTGCANAATSTTVLVATKTTESYCNGTLDFSVNALSNTGYNTVINSGVITGTKLTSDARWLQGSLGGSVSANTKSVKIYVNDGIIAYYTVPGNTNAWGPVAVDSLLSQNDILTIAVTEDNGSSSEMICASTKIICDCATSNKPTRPTLSNSSTTQVGVGVKASVVIQDPQNNNLYALKNYYTGKALSSGIYYTGGNVSVNARGMGVGETLTINEITVDSTQTVQIDAHRIGGTETCTDSTSFQMRQLIVLPVTISEFKGVQGNKKNILSWKTITEIGFSYFELQKSTDGNNYQLIAKINANGNASSYSHDDNNLAGKVNYYRLKMVDVDGRFKYSNTVVITETGSSVVLNTIRPNPFVNRLVISLHLEKAQEVNMILVDAAGRQVRTSKANAEKGYNDIWVNNLDGLSKGMYILKIYADGNVYQEKLVKLN